MDTLRLVIAPVVVGQSRRLFPGRRSIGRPAARQPS
ncbi:hypothetical protein [Streptomyces sp. NPDC000880]